jgi:hypothetical protein
VKRFQQEGAGFGGLPQRRGRHDELVGVVDHAQPPRRGLVVSGVEEHQTEVPGRNRVERVKVVLGDPRLGREQFRV